MPSVHNPSPESTELANTYYLFSEQNNILEELVSNLEKSGHKLKDTNFPTESNQTQSKGQEPNGFTTDFQLQVNRVTNANARLRTLVDKLNSII